MQPFFFIYSEGTEEGEPTEETPDAEAEPEKREMTLDEWKAQQTASKPKPDFKIRKAGEGCENSEWKKMFVLKKKVEEEESEEEDEEYEVL